MIFVDSGYFIALLRPRDRLRVRASGWGRLLSEQLLTTEYVLWESISWFSPPRNRVKIHDVIAAVQADSRWQIVPASSQLFASGLASHRQHEDKEWSLTDCISFIVMRERKCLSRPNSRPPLRASRLRSPIASRSTLTLSSGFIVGSK